jgi:hypothetical protein
MALRDKITILSLKGEKMEKKALLLGLILPLGAAISSFAGCPSGYIEEDTEEWDVVSDGANCPSGYTEISNLNEAQPGDVNGLTDSKGAYSINGSDLCTVQGS